jgi:hypothetical protein
MEWMVGIAFIMVHTTTIATAIIIACFCWMPFATSLQQVTLLLH